MAGSELRKDTLKEERVQDVEETHDAQGSIRSEKEAWIWNAAKVRNRKKSRETTKVEADEQGRKLIRSSDSIGSNMLE